MPIVPKKSMKITLNNIEHTDGKTNTVPEEKPIVSTANIPKGMPVKATPTILPQIPVQSSIDAETAHEIEYKPISEVHINMFSDVLVSKETMKEFRKTAIISMVRTKFGNLIPVMLNTVGNCIAMENDPHTLSWLATIFNFVRKVKAMNGEVYVDISIADDLNEKIIRVPASSFGTDNIKKLEQYGIVCFPADVLTLSIYCQQMIANLPTEAAEQSLGFTFNKEMLSFCGYDTNILESRNNFQDENEYIRALNDLIIDSIPVQYVLASSMGAAVMTALKFCYNMDLHSYCINLVGPSSTGKTITTKLAASMWGNPNDKKLFTSMMSTNNAMFKMIGVRMGLPIFLD